MRTISHPNIVSFKQILMEKSRVYLIQQYCQQGDLAYHIRRQIRKKNSYFNQSLISKWLLQLLLALEYLHNKKIMHRDIKPQNIFLTSQGNLKLGSFRSSKLFNGQNQLAQTALSSQYYIAPQCLQNQKYDQKVDIWAFGFILYQLCSLKQMFQDNNYIQQVNVILKGHNKPIPSIYSKQLQDIYYKCLTRNHKMRPSAKQLLRQPYFLQKMKNIINQTYQLNNRIPIKHYKVHMKILANKKQKDIVSIKQNYVKIKQTPKRPSAHSNHSVKSNKSPLLINKSPLLPKIQHKVKQSPSTHKKTKQDKINKINSPKTNSIQKKNQPTPKISKNKSINKLKQQKKQDKKQLLVKKRMISSRQKNQKIKNQDILDKKLMAPPILPKPHKKIQRIERKTIDNSQKQTIDLSQTMKPISLSSALTNLSKSPSHPIQRNQIIQIDKQVKKSIQKVFIDLNLNQQQQQQFSFDLQDEQLARLTMKKTDDKLVQTYKDKLQQLIDQINYKYSPIMDSIQQRTQQFDSNTFAQFK